MSSERLAVEEPFNATPPLFSILVPVYNVRRYLDGTLDSILAQTCTDYEVVLIDDGSTDGSGNVCDAFAISHDDVTVVHQENKGLLLARRAALLEARGSYIVTLDSDDALRADALERLAHVIKDCHPDIIAFAYTRARDYRVFGPSRLDMAAGYYEGEGYKAFQSVVCRGKHNNLWGKCYKRAIADIDVDYSMYRGLTHAEDLLQLVPLAQRARSFYYLDEALYYYRPNPSSSTASYKGKQLEDLSVALSSLLSYAESLGQPYLDEARRGALMQISYLIHILVMSDIDEDEKSVQLELIRTYAMDAGLFGPWCRDLRFDKKLEMRALGGGNTRLLSRIVQVLMVAKRAHDRRSGVLDGGDNAG